MTHALDATQYQGLRSTMCSATSGAAMALVAAINLDTMIEQNKKQEGKLTKDKDTRVVHVHVSISVQLYILIRGEPCKNETFWAYSDPRGFRG